MASEDLPNEFDVIVVGTGLTETIVAAALSRIGLKVLHLDRNNYYGGTYANFSLESIEAWKLKNMELVQDADPSSKPDIASDVGKLLKDGEKVVVLPPEPPRAFNMKSRFYIRERTPEEEAVAEAKKSKSKFHYSPLNIQQNLELKHVTDESSVTQENKDIQESDLEEKHKEEDVSEETVQVEDDKNNSSAGKVMEDADILSGQAPHKSGLADDDDGRQAESQPDPAAGDSLASAVKNGDKPEETDMCQSKEWTVGDIKDEWRRFCFDISPKILYSCGELIELLIQSDVARYCEFRTVSRVLTFINDRLEQVPCSRADLFSSKIVSLVEKRLMMKFLQFAAEYEKHPEEYREHKGKPFVDFLKSKRLPPNICHFVQHAIAMVTDSATTEEGLKSTQAFLHSLGRYGNTAFLFPLYGTGELPQAFARLSAVFGGTYCLMTSPTHIITDSDNKCCGIIASNGQSIRCKYMVAECSYLPPSFILTLSSRKTSRAIYITDSSVLQSKEAELSLLNFVPKDDPTRPVTFLELPPSACVCPQSLFVIHLTRIAGSDDSEQDFAELREKLFAPETSGEDRIKPKILWSLYFTQEDKSQVTSSDLAVENVLAASAGGDTGVDLDFCVQEAKCIFNTICPEEEFLPKPPNPDDIIHVDDVDAAVATGPSEYETKDNEAGDSETEVSEKDVDKKGDSAQGSNDIESLGSLVEKVNIETGES